MMEEENQNIIHSITKLVVPLDLLICSLVRLMFLVKASARFVSNLSNFHKNLFNTGFSNIRNIRPHKYLLLQKPKKEADYLLI
jgi:hypothetical protein